MSASAQSLPSTASRTSLLQTAGSVMPSWRAISPTVFYCARTLLAVALSLYVAFSLQLLSPSSSAITVLIVANPNNGALVSKSLWRLFGTCIGASAAVLLMAAFAQTPMLFFIALSLAIGVACFVSTLLRYFRAYGAVLAGYTIIIVCAPAFADPGNVFLSALSRLSAVSVGIVSAALVFLLTSLRTPSLLSNAALGVVRGIATALLGQVVPAGARPWRGGDVPDEASDDASGLHESRISLLARCNALVETIEYAAADSHAVARRADALRHGAAGLMGTLSSLHPLTPRVPPDDPATLLFGESLQALQEIAPDNAAPLLQRLATLRDGLSASLHATGGCDLSRLAALDRAVDLVARLHDAIGNLLMPQASSGSPVRLRQFLDWRTALRNGARGAIVTMLACLFWYITQWPSGPSLLAFLVPASCLLATNPSASRASIDFSIGTLLAIPASYVCATWMLPQISGFPLLIAALGLCLLPGIWLQFSPRHGLRAFGYVVFFSAMISIRNPVSFDDVTLVNGWLAFALGTASLIVVFRALLPADAVRDSNRLARALSLAAAQAATARRLPDTAAWEYLRMQQVLRLIQRLHPLEAAIRQRVVSHALITVDLGRDLLRLRGMLAGAVLEPPERARIDAALQALGRLRHDPMAAANAAASAAALLAARPSLSRPLARIAALLHEVALLIEAIAAFLSRDFTVSDAR